MAPALSRLTVSVFAFGGIARAYAADAVLAPAAPLPPQK